MKNRKRIFIISLFLLILVITAVTWDSLVIHIAPKAVLTSALSKVFSQLEERFQNDPLLILCQSIDPEGKYTASIKMETDNNLLGPVSYDMIVQTDGKNHCLSASGTAATAKKEMDLSLYMDTEFIAVSSDSLVNGEHYGISYESFEEDIRSIPLLSFMVSDHLLTQWGNSVKNIQAQMQQNYSLPVLSDINANEIKALLLGVIAMPCEIEETSFLLDGTAVVCDKLNYTVRGQQVGEFLTELTHKDFGEDAAITASFYLYEKTLIRITLVCKAEEQLMQVGVDLGLNPKENPISLQGIHYGVETTDLFTAKVNTLQGENLYTEHWELETTIDDSTNRIAFDFEWEPVSGAMRLNVNDISETVSLILQKRENGVYVNSYDFCDLLQVITRKDNFALMNGTTSCEMTVTKGSEIVKPEYKNLDQWSMEDFLGLLNGVGALIGLKFNS